MGVLQDGKKLLLGHFTNNFPNHHHPNINLPSFMHQIRFTIVLFLHTANKDDRPRPGHHPHRKKIYRNYIRYINNSFLVTSIRTINIIYTRHVSKQAVKVYWPGNNCFWGLSPRLGLPCTAITLFLMMEHDYQVFSNTNNN